jgi:hypothetical protein
MVNHELTRHGPGNVPAEIFLDHGQRQIDHGSHARGGPYRAVLDEDAILFDTHARVGLPQRVGVLPMGGGPLAVEQAGGGQPVQVAVTRRDVFAADVMKAIIARPTGSRLAPPTTKIVSKRGCSSASV